MQDTREIQVQFLGQEDPLGEEMATHWSILPGNPVDKEAWWPTVHESQRAGHDWSD